MKKLLLLALLCINEISLCSSQKLKTLELHNAVATTIDQLLNIEKLTPSNFKSIDNNFKINFKNFLEPHGLTPLQTLPKAERAAISSIQEALQAEVYGRQTRTTILSKLLDIPTIQDSVLSGITTHILNNIVNNVKSKEFITDSNISALKSEHIKNFLIELTTYSELYIPKSKYSLSTKVIIDNIVESINKYNPDLLAQIAPNLNKNTIEMIVKSPNLTTKGLRNIIDNINEKYLDSTIELLSQDQLKNLLTESQTMNPDRALALSIKADDSSIILKTTDDLRNFLNEKNITDMQIQQTQEKAITDYFGLTKKFKASVDFVLDVIKYNISSLLDFIATLKQAGRAAIKNLKSRFELITKGIENRESIDKIFEEYGKQPLLTPEQSGQTEADILLQELQRAQEAQTAGQQTQTTTEEITIKPEGSQTTGQEPAIVEEPEEDPTISPKDLGSGIIGEL